MNPSQKIKFICENFIKNNKNYSINKPIRIKLSADGTSISDTKINLVNFTFELLDDWKYSQKERQVQTNTSPKNAKENERTSSVFMIYILGIIIFL